MLRLAARRFSSRHVAAAAAARPPRQATGAPELDPSYDNDTDNDNDNDNDKRRRRTRHPSTLVDIEENPSAARVGVDPFELLDEEVQAEREGGFAANEPAHIEAKAQALYGARKNHPTASMTRENHISRLTIARDSSSPHAVEAQNLESIADALRADHAQRVFAHVASLEDRAAECEREADELKARALYLRAEIAGKT